MRARRLLLLALTVLLGSIAISALLTPTGAREGSSDGVDRPAAPTGEGSASPARGEDPLAGEGVDVLLARRTGQRIEAAAGEELRVEVRSSSPVTVQVGEDGPIDVADAGAPAWFDLLIEEGFDAEVTLLDPKRVVIGRITARPVA